MIHQIHLRDFKAHRATQVDLGRFTMLVGDNASGKTSVLDALWLQSALNPNPVQVLRGNWSPDDLLRRGASGPILLVSKGEQENQPWTTTIKFEFVPKRNKEADREWKLILNGTRGTAHLPSGTAVSSGGVIGNWNTLGTTVGNVGFYRLSADKISAAAYSDRPDAVVEADGTNTAVVLAAMKLGNDESFERIEQAIRKLIPAVERVRLQRATVNLSAPERGSVVGSKLYFDFRGATGVPGHNASHGTLIVLALLTVLHSSPRPNLILLDDFDHALHPRAQMELVRMIKDLLALDEFKDLQVVATTHSPYTLDELDPSDVQVFALREDGTVASKRLSEHPEAEKVKGTLRAGQLWSLDPEHEWVLRDQ